MIHQPVDAGAQTSLRLALMDLYLAHRAPGEDYTACFARIGAPGYAAILREELVDAAAV